MSDVHNHAWGRGPHGDCNERVLADGSRRGACMGPQVGETVRLAAYDPTDANSLIWDGYKARVVALGNVVDHAVSQALERVGVATTSLAPIEPRPDAGIGTFLWKTDCLTILPAFVRPEAEKVDDGQMHLAWKEYSLARIAELGESTEREAFEAGWRTALRIAVVLVTPDTMPETEFESGQDYGLTQAIRAIERLGGGS